MKVLNLDPMLIDGKPVTGTLTIDQDWVDVSTSVESRPDPSWGEPDAAGHFHGWAEGGELPTLKKVSVHVPCERCGGVSDGPAGWACEDGYTTTEYRCLICDEQVYPRWIVNTNPPPRKVPGRTSWTAKVSALIGCGEIVSIVAGPYLGIGKSVEVSASSDGVTSTLVCGPMAKRLTVDNVHTGGAA